MNSILRDRELRDLADALDRAQDIVDDLAGYVTERDPDLSRWTDQVLAAIASAARYLHELREAAERAKGSAP